MKICIRLEESIRIAWNFHKVLENEETMFGLLLGVPRIAESC